MDSKINIDYIGVVKENDGRYTYEQVEIKRSEELMVTLDTMLKNPNRTLLDLQDCFTTHFGVKPKTAYDCCLPYTYDSSYIGYVSLPWMMTIEQYHANKQETADKARKEIAERVKNNTTFYSVTSEGIEQEINSRITDWSEHLKEKFYSEAIRYIQAVDFTVTTEFIKCNSRVRMLSHEHIGWRTIKHNISDDLIITINTNFGYGASSYFLFNVCYKGIDLLPYSLLVKYYYAGIAEIKRCTRSYRPDRDNWALAMDFVADIGNKTQAGELSFVKDWLKHEIDEMISCLYAINANPKGVLDDIKGRPVDYNGLRCVRGLGKGELKQFELYPDEMSIAFKASKLTAALDLIDKLQVAGEVYTPALEAIDKIKDINRLFAPELEKWIAKILSKIESLSSELLQPKEQLALVEERLRLHDKEIDAIYYADTNPRKSRSTTINEYRQKHSEFVELENSRNRLVAKIDDIDSRIRNYTDFASVLQNCYQRIDNKVLMCA